LPKDTVTKKKIFKCFDQETKLVELTKEITSLKQEGNQELKDSLQVTMFPVLP
jgi:hypothetical protein